MKSYGEVNAFVALSSTIHLGLQNEVTEEASKSKGGSKATLLMSASIKPQRRRAHPFHSASKNIQMNNRD